MSASPISWVENIPSGTSTVGSFPPLAHSVWTAIATGMATELFWPGVGGGSNSSAGLLHPGASRFFVGTRSQSSNSATGDIVGRGFLASDQSILLVYDSTGTYLGGSPFCVEYSTTTNAVGGSHLDTTGYLVQFAKSVTLASGISTTTYNATFPKPFINSQYAVYFTCSSGSTGQGNYFVTLASKTSAGFSATVSILPNSLSGGTIMWQAIGQTATV